MSELNGDEKRHFLKFVTGSPRLPYGGIIQFFILKITINFFFLLFIFNTLNNKDYKIYIPN